MSAANLGELTLKSGLGELLKASIVIESATARELDTLQATFADPKFSRQKGVVLPENMHDLRLQIDKTNEQPTVILSSVSAIKEPFLNLIIQLSWTAGTFLREYTILIDPVVNEGDNYITFGGVEAREIETSNDINLDHYQYDDLGNITTIPRMQAARPQTSKSRSEVNKSGTVIVRRGDNLMAIARVIAPDFVTVEQVTTALYRVNPHAFFGSIDRLKAGAILEIPSVAEMQLQTYHAAKATLRKPKVQTPPAKATANAGSAATPQTPTVVDQLPATSPDSVNPIESALATDEMNTQQSLTKPLQEIHTVVSELQASIGELRVTLDRKSNQLDAVSNRINQLQREQAVLTQQTLMDKQSNESIDKLASPTKENATAGTHLEISNPSLGAKDGTDTPQSTQSDNVTNNKATQTADALDGGDQPTNDSQSVPETAISDSDQSSEQPASSTMSTELSVTEKLTEPRNAASDPNSIAYIDAHTWYKNGSGYQPLFDRMVRLGLMSLAMVGLYLIFVRLVIPRLPSLPRFERRSSLADAYVHARSSNVHARSSHELTEKRTLENYFDSQMIDKQQGTQSAPGRRDNGVNTPAPGSLSGKSNQSTSKEGAVLPSEQPLEAWFDAQLSENERREKDLLVAMETYPQRQEIRLKLLKLYADRKATAKFEALAHSIYQMTDRDSTVWHHVIEMGLALDANLQFYPQDPSEDNSIDFELPTTRIVNSVPAGTTVDTSHREHEVSNKVQVDLGSESSSSDTPLSLEIEPTSDDNDASETVESESGDNTNQPNSIETDKPPSSANFGNEELDIVLDMTLLDPGVSNSADEESTDAMESQNSDSSQISEPSSIADPPLITDPSLIPESPTGTSEIDTTPTNSDRIRTSTKQGDRSPTNKSRFQSHSIANSISDWKQTEIKLDLAILQYNMGNHDQARELFHEILETGDSLQQEVAKGMLSKIS